MSKNQQGFWKKSSPSKGPFTHGSDESTGKSLGRSNLDSIQLSIKDPNQKKLMTKSHVVKPNQNLNQKKVAWESIDKSQK